MTTPWRSRRPPKARFTQATKQQALNQTGGLCTHCGHTATAIDHITPVYLALQQGWALDDINHIDNATPICDDCHRTKTNAESAHARQQANKRRQKPKAKHPGLK